MTRYESLCEKIVDTLNAAADIDVYRVASGATPLIMHLDGAVVIPTLDWDAKPLERYLITAIRRDGSLREFKLDHYQGFDATAVHAFVLGL